MGYANVTLEGYYLKCGAPADEAKIISSLFGEDYIKYQAQMRAQGGGNQSKALAAAWISDVVLKEASESLDTFMWENANCYDELLSVLKVSRAAGLCSIAVYSYALNDDISYQIKSAYERVLMLANIQCSVLGVEFDLDKAHNEFTLTVDRLCIEAKAHGKRKGLLTKLFG